MRPFGPVFLDETAKQFQVEFGARQCDELMAFPSTVNGRHRKAVDMKEGEGGYQFVILK
jgi:hypothetical protein